MSSEIFKQNFENVPFQRKNPMEEFMLENIENLNDSFIKRNGFLYEHLLDLQNHDLNTFKHSVEVGNMANYVISELGDGLDKSEAEDLLVAALLHDYGKVELDPRILNKLEDLSTDERKEIRKHPGISHDSLKELSERVRLTIGGHHLFQKDPYGVEAEKIIKDPGTLRLVKILSMIDSFQAMTDPARPSNKNGIKPIEEVCSELQRKFANAEENEAAKQVPFLLGEYYYRKHPHMGKLRTGVDGQTFN